MVRQVKTTTTIKRTRTRRRSTPSKKASSGQKRCPTCGKYM